MENFFLPAVGYRLNTDGSLTQQESEGVYWASEQLNSTNGRRVRFFSHISEPSLPDGANKAFGLSIRCVREINVWNFFLASSRRSPYRWCAL